MTRPARHLLGLTLGAAGAGAVLLASGHGILAAPPIEGGFGGVRAWAEERDALTAALALSRLVALLLAAYLAVAVLLGVAARLLRRVTAAADSVVRILDALTPLVLRSALDTAFTVSTAVAALGLALGPAAPSPAAERPSRAATAERAPTLRRVVEPPPAPPSTRPTPSPPAAASATGPAPAEPPTWTVRRGEHFWAIAEAVVAQRNPGRTPTEREVARYWLRLIAANRQRLPVPDDPDLLFPGSVLVLP